MAANDSLLTDLERQVIADLGVLWNKLCRVVGDGPPRVYDLEELVAHVHALQQAVMSNAAGRAYPGEFRCLGETLRPPVSNVEADADP